MLIISYPILLVFNSNPISFTFWDTLGALIFMVGFIYESVADYQLAEFKKHPGSKDSILQTGLWKHSRHPNYFGETLVWWGIYLVAIPTNYGWTGIISPLLITFLLLYITGVPILEGKLSKKPGWDEYRAKTPKFFPNIL
jgi:steroid 5-alpha reductase family enzyme